MKWFLRPRFSWAELILIFIIGDCLQAIWVAIT